MINKLTIHEASEGLLNKKFSAVELTAICLETIDRQDKELNAFITVTADNALAAAAKVDQRIASGDKLGVLAGIPIAIKDNIVVQGVKATAGCKILSEYVAPYNATVVERLKAAGAVILGKTNLDEFAMGSSGETSHFGPTKNPLDKTRVSGGSSSGSTVAVASHEAIAAIGSDTGGSVRQPASFCGVVGFKPTYGRISRHGLMAMASSLDQIGSLTKDVHDAAILFEVMAGVDSFDSTTVSQKASVLKTLTKSIKGKKIGFPRDYFLAGMDPQVMAETEKTLEIFRSLGAKVVDIKLPKPEYALAAYYILMPAEVSSNLARMDGVRYGNRAEAGNLLEQYLETRSQGFGDEVKRRIILGTYVLSSGYYDAFYKKAQQVRRLIKNGYDEAFKTVDCILTPTAPTTAFKIGEKFDNPMTMYLADIFTVSVNIAGLPAISVPGVEIDGLPLGMQLIGNYFDEANLLNIAHQLFGSLRNQ